MRSILPLLFAAAALAQPRVELKAVCADAEINEFALECSEDEPCPVFLDLVMAEPVGNRIFLTGNFHTRSATLWSLLLASDDNGNTWSEPSPRAKSVTLDQIQFIDFQNGWVSGHTVTSLPRDPFLLRTADGGKTWTSLPVFDESRVGYVEHFSFDSATQGSIVINRGSSAEGGRYLRLETPNGGQTWMLREASPKPPPSKRPRGTATNNDWRVRADAAIKSFRLERREAQKWSTVTVFSFSGGACKPAPPPPPEPAPPQPAVSATIQ